MNNPTISPSVSLLAPWSVTSTLRDWWALPPDLRKRTVLAAAELPLSLSYLPPKRAAAIKALAK